MASERLLILQPHNWSLRRGRGMLLYFNRCAFTKLSSHIVFSGRHKKRNLIDDDCYRRYVVTVQELSICMAFAPVEEAEVLEPFVEKLHLLRVESSWKSLDQAGSLAVP